MNLILENVRCFDGKNIVPIKPLTIITGENSSGKSTLLAMLSLVCNFRNFPFLTDFNEIPFELGSFDTIATNKGGRYGRADSFCFGYDQVGEKGVTSEFTNRRGQAVLKKVVIESERIKIEVEVMGEKKKKMMGKVVVKGSGDTVVKEFPFESEIEAEDYEMLQHIFPWTLMKAIGEGKLTKEEHNLFVMLRGLAPRSAISLSPIRSKPERTHDKLKTSFSPEGGHIPSVLAKILSEESTSEDREVIQSALRKFGADSGLFADIDVQLLGPDLSFPFQVRAAIWRRRMNLLDVGYGVNQALPVIVQSILTPKSDLLLLQQPEVHLHPKAQAALGTFFAELVASKKQEFVIETHSDYIVDRVRQEVASGKLDPSVVSILFLHRVGYETSISDLRLDERGSIINAPSHYREFFLREELALINRGS